MSKAVSVEQINAIPAALAAATEATRAGDCKTEMEPISATMEAILASEDLPPDPEAKEIDQEKGQKDGDWL